MIVTNTANRTSNDKLSKLLDVLNKRFRLNIQSDPDGPAIKIVLKWDSGIVRNRKMSKELTEFESDPYSLFIFAINSPLTKQKYIPRLNKFFDFINLSGTIQERCKAFVKKSKDEPSCVVAYVIKYLQMIKERVEKRRLRPQRHRFLLMTSVNSFESCMPCRPLLSIFLVRRYNLISETSKGTLFLNQLNNKNYRISRLNSSPVAVYKWINKYVTLM